MKRRRPATLEPIAASAIVIVSLHVAITFGLLWWWQNHSERQSRAQQPLAWLSPADFKNTLPVSPSSTAPSKSPRTPPLAKSPAVTPTPPPAAAVVSAPPATPVSPPPSPALAVNTAMPPELPPSTAEDEPVQKATLIAAPPDRTRMEPIPNDAPTPLFAPAMPVVKPSANRSITLRRTRSKPAVPTAGKTPAPPMSSPTLLDIARLNSMRPNSLPKAGSAPPPEDIDNIKELDAVDEALNAAFLGIWTAPPIDSVPPGQREARVNLSVGRDGSIVKTQMSKFSGSHVLDQSILETAAAVKKIPVTLPSNYSKDSYDVELNFLLLP